MDNYRLFYEPGWDVVFSKMDKSLQTRIFKKIQQLKTAIHGRHLQHGLPFFVKEVGGWRILYSSDEQSRTRKIYFVGSHKDYETWYRSR